tara:strand:- start:38 stop:256 length:219 start_codon:yes stop_codon:yes gene_type:complete
MVLVKRVSPLTGLENEMMLDITSEQVEEWNRPAGERRLIQEIFSNLSEDEREFIQTGYTPSDWKEMEKAFAE